MRRSRRHQESWSDDGMAVLTGWTLAQVIVLAQQGEGGLPAAWAELAWRSRSWRVPFVIWLARRGRLPEDDLADAQIQADLAIREAAEKYVPGGDPNREEERWQNFLSKVIERRIKTFLRTYRRAERGLDRHLQADAIPPEQRRSRHPAEEDPVMIATRSEVLARLRQAVAQLPELDRQIAAGLMDDQSAVGIARELGITRGRIRGRVAELRVWLRPYLQDLKDVLDS